MPFFPKEKNYSLKINSLNVNINPLSIKEKKT